MAGRKQDLLPHEQKLVVALIRRLAQEAGTVTELSRRLTAKELGISQQTLGKYIAEPPLATPGFGAASLLAKYAGIDVFDLLQRRKPRSAGEMPLIREIDGWEEASAQYAQEHPRVARKAIEDVGDTATRAAPERVTTDFIGQMLVAFRVGREAAEEATAQAKAELAAERKKRGHE